MCFHGQITARGARLLLGSSTYLILTQIDRVLYIPDLGHIPSFDQQPSSQHHGIAGQSIVAECDLYIYIPELSTWQAKQ